MSVTIELNLRPLNSLQKNLPQRVGQTLRALAFDGEGFMKKGMGTSPSQPGEFPGVETGKLRNSIRAEKESTFAWEITTDDEKAPYLEFGTSRMAPRPFMAPTLDYLAQVAPERFAGFLEKSL
jgi:hypothetical protein